MLNYKTYLRLQPYKHNNLYPAALRRGKTLLLLLLVLLTVASCSNNISNGSAVMLVFSETESEMPIPLPYIEDFENGSFNNAQDLSTCYKWKIADDNGNSVLMCADFEQNTSLPGNPVFYLLIGDKNWNNYTFSFDCKIAHESWISFAPYADTNSNYNTPDYLEGSRNPWSMKLDYEGVLLYQTVFGHGTQYIGEPSNKLDEAYNTKSKPIEGFISEDWNHIELSSADNEIIMEINGVNIGKVAEIHDGISGRVSVGGGVGAIFDNIVVSKNNN